MSKNASRKAKQKSLYRKDPKGVRNDYGKAPLALIPPEAEYYEALVWGQGAEEYGLWNFRQGMSITRILSSLLRHANHIKQGIDYDKKSGLPHAAHVRANAAMLICFLGREDLDDRYKQKKKNRG